MNDDGETLSLGLQVRQTVRERAEEALAKEQRLDNGPLADAVTEELIGDPRTLAGLRTLLRGLAYRELIAWARERRNAPAPDGSAVVPTTGGVVTQALIDQQTAASRWARWVEHVGDRVVELGALRKPDLRVAAEERGKRIGTEWVRMQFLLALDRRLPNDKVKVEDHFSHSELETLYTQTERLAVAQLRAAGKALERPAETNAAQLAVEDARRKLLPGAKAAAGD